VQSDSTLRTLAAEEPPPSSFPSSYPEERPLLQLPSRGSGGARWTVRCPRGQLATAQLAAPDCFRHVDGTARRRVRRPWQPWGHIAFKLFTNEGVLSPALRSELRKSCTLRDPLRQDSCHPPGEGRQSPNGVDPRALDILLPEAEDIQQRTPHLGPARCRKRRNERTDVPPLDDSDPLGFENAALGSPSLIVSGASQLSARVCVDKGITGTCDNEGNTSARPKIRTGRRLSGAANRNQRMSPC
jgi:hypothetical protein